MSSRMIRRRSSAQESDSESEMHEPPPSAVRSIMSHPSRMSFSIGSPTPGLENAPARVITVNNPDANASQHFGDNSITTSKYTVYSFLPRNLLEQFRRAANTYFLLIAILQVIPGVSPINPWTSILPLLFVLAVTGVKEALEDVRRHKTDNQINNSEAHILRGTSFATDIWANVHVGDIVRLSAGHSAPADMVILSTEAEQGMCYIETAQLDGETNLKIRQARPETQHLSDVNSLARFKGLLECEPPNESLYTFSGSLQLMADGRQKKIPLDLKQVFLRGCTLRNTPNIYGVVVYTGHDTKLMKNGRQSRAKRSTLEMQMNLHVIAVFIIMVTIVLFCALYAGFWAQYTAIHQWYLAYAPNFDTAVYGALQFLTFIILYNVLIPISLYVSVEMVKVAQALLINFDREMYHDITNTPAAARTSNLSEELGQIEYIFSDKTGTLTCNTMEFLKCCIGGIVYGTGSTEIGRAAARRRGEIVPEPPPRIPGRFNFKDDQLLKNLKDGHYTAPIIREFLTLLAVCHTVLPHKEDDGTMSYQAASPDEGALVAAAMHLGAKFTKRTPRSVTIEFQGEEETYEILNVLEFSSTRKRMSAIVRSPTGVIKLYCKGADTVIYSRLREGVGFEDITLQQLETFASEGLRTLVLAVTVLDEMTYEEWNRVWYKASISLQNRDKKLEDAADIIERNLVLLGATAIEDRLQDGVPECIAQLAKADINIWVLTGDKQETAINIGFACSLLTQDMDVIIINAGSSDLKLRVKEARNQIADAMAKKSKDTATPKALVVDGFTLEAALTEDLAAEFVALAKLCKAVVCCRVSPKQKADVVTLVRDHLGSITLAIGDGANDVAMIQAAHVGVGISGQEGMQAVLASDYALAQFRFLQRLLLVHGRWSYKRIASLILYSFQKNFAFCLVGLWFQFFCGFSGQTLVDSWYITTYNMIWTGAPVLVLAALEQDVSASMSLKFPTLYITGHQHVDFNKTVFAGWLLEGVWQSLLLFFIPMGCYMTSIRADGMSDDLVSLGTLVYSCVVVTVNIKVACMARYWTWLHHLTIWGSILGWFAFVSIYHAFYDLTVYFVVYKLFISPAYWLCIIFTAVLSQLPAIIYTYVQRMFYPRPSDVVQEMQKLGIRFDEPEEKTALQASVEVPATGFAPQSGPGPHLSLRNLVTAVSAIRLMQNNKEVAFRGFHFAHEGGEKDFMVAEHLPDEEFMDAADQEEDKQNELGVATSTSTPLAGVIEEEDEDAEIDEIPPPRTSATATATPSLTSSPAVPRRISGTSYEGNSRNISGGGPNSQGGGGRGKNVTFNHMQLNTIVTDSRDEDEE